MLRAVITFCLNYRLVVLLGAIVLLVAGAVTAHRAPWDVFPEFAPPQVVVQTEAPGLSTEEVEQLVTVPIESAINGVYGLDTLRSSSAAGLSVVTAIFQEGTDVLSARQLINERLVEVKRLLPDTAESPQLTPLQTSISRVATVGLTSDSLTEKELRTFADWTLRRRLLAVRGVAQVEVYGGEVKQYQVLVSPEKLAQLHVTLGEVVTSAQNATGFGGAGYVETTNQRLPVRQRTRIETEKDLAAAPVSFRGGASLTLGQVADVQVGAADKFGDATINGKPGVMLVIHKQPNVDTLGVSEAIDRSLDELERTLPHGITLHRTLFRQATFIQHAMSNLQLAILVGCAFVIFVLVAFLSEWRTVVINLTAIPLSLLGAILLLRLFGASLNAMTLGGLAIALGVVVDDAIVDVENVLRRLQENRHSEHPRAAFQVVLDASIEVRGAIVFASFIVILVFLPVFFLEGLAGTLFRSMGYAYAAAVFLSLLVALTVTPAMCLAMLPHASAERRDSVLVRVLKSVFAKLLGRAIRHSRITIATTLAILVLSLAAIPWLGGEFLPEFKESNLVIFMVGKPDMALGSMVKAGEQVAARLLKVDGVKSVAQQAGRAELSEDTYGPNISEIAVALDDRSDFQAIMDRVRDALDDFPGFEFQIKQFLRERIDEVLTGVTTDIVVRVVGPDLGELRTQAGKIVAAIQDTPGVKDLRIEQQVDVPQIEVLLRPADASRLGFSVADLNGAIQTLLRGKQVGQIYEGEQVFDVVVRSLAALRADPTQIGGLLVDSPTGEKVPLRSVASIGFTEGPNVINREEGSRRILVTCNAEGRDLGSIMKDIQSKIDDKVRLPSGYALEYGGEYQAKQEAQSRLLLLGVAALVGIFIMLYLDFRNVRLTLLVLLSVPFACVGGIVAVLFAGGDISLGSLVGFVAVFGIAVRNGILLVSHYEHLQNVEGMRFGPELLLRGAIERLAPILMTACAAGLALLPLALLGNRPGHEIEHPMAIVILGGLATSTFLSLIVLPILYLKFARPAQLHQLAHASQVT